MSIFLASFSYCDTINSIVHIIQQRQFMPHLQNDFMFGMTPMKREYDRAMKVLHTFTKDVIKEKRAIFEAGGGFDADKPKGRVAFLDLLMATVLPDGSKLNNDDIQEEVDTFMFEGHDTTACGISWTLYLLGQNQEVK